MVRHVDAIFSQGAFWPLKPLPLPEGTYVHLSVKVQAAYTPAPSAVKIHTPKLTHREDGADFLMEVRIDVS